MKSANKEIQQIKQAKLIDRPMGSKNRLNYIQEQIYKNITKGEDRFNKLNSALDANFPLNSPDRGFVDAILIMAFDTTLELLFLNKNTSLIVELQGAIERFCINALCDILPVNTTTARDVISQMIDKKNLSDVAPYFETLGLWDEKDVKFAQRLTKLRNGIAHKNAEIVSKCLSDGRQKHFGSIDSITEKMDCIPYIIDVLKLIVKISFVITNPIDKNPRLQARYNRYLSSIGLLAGLFCIPDLMTMPKDLKDFYLIEFFAPLYLISTEMLNAKLKEYHIKVVDFHDSLNTDDTKARQLHSELCDLCNEIFSLMQSEIKIDFDRNLLEDKPKNITMEEIRQIKEKQSEKKPSR